MNIEDIEAREKAAKHLGFLALKAEQYARFPSIRKMSEDWHHIALIAADGYNGTAYLLAELAEAREKLEAVKAAAGRGQYVWASELDRILHKEGE